MLRVTGAARAPAATAGSHCRTRRLPGSLRVRPPLGIDLRAGPILRFSGTDGGDALADRNLQPFGRPHRVVETRQRDARQLLADRSLDRPELAFLLGRDER